VNDNEKSKNPSVTDSSGGYKRLDFVDDDYLELLFDLEISKVVEQRLADNRPHIRVDVNKDL
jgi:hypothetical protein